MKSLIRSGLVGALANRTCASWFRPRWEGRAAGVMVYRPYHPAPASTGHSAESIASSIAAIRAAGARIVSLRSLFESHASGGAPEPGSVAFTIDDGYADQAGLARQFLQNDCPVTIFLVSGFLDRKLWPWDQQLEYCVLKSPVDAIELPGVPKKLRLRSDHERHAATDILQRHVKSLRWPQAQAKLADLWRLLNVSPPNEAPAGTEALTWNEARQLESEGVDFGPHSVTHRVASSLTDEESREEVQTSWKRLQDELRRPLPIYAWPTGRAADFSMRDQKIAQDLGLGGAVSTNIGYGNFSSATSTNGAMFGVNRFAFSSDIETNVQYATAIELI